MGLQRQKKRKLALVVSKNDRRSSPSLGPLKKRRFVDVSTTSTSHLHPVPEGHLAIPSSLQHSTYNYHDERMVAPIDLNYSQVPGVVNLFQQTHFSDQVIVV